MDTTIAKVNLNNTIYKNHEFSFNKEINGVPQFTSTISQMRVKLPVLAIDYNRLEFRIKMR